MPWKDLVLSVLIQTLRLSLTAHYEMVLSAAASLWCLDGFAPMAQEYLPRVSNVNGGWGRGALHTTSTCNLQKVPQASGK